MTDGKFDNKGLSHRNVNNVWAKYVIANTSCMRHLFLRPSKKHVSIKSRLDSLGYIRNTLLFSLRKKNTRDD